jgi:DNA-binding LytR/AlgR family response regulator
MTLRTLIVDDEPVARQILREELELMTDVEIVGEAGDGASALEAIARSRPDLVLLDLQMPGMSGFDVVRSFQRGPHLPVVIVVTAFDQHAIEAFEAGAIDYLLKPVGEERLHRAIERARQIGAGARGAAEQLARLQEVAESQTGPARLRVVGRAGDEYVLLSVDEIYAFQSEGEMVWIRTAGKKYLAAHTLRALQERLRHTNFRRIHRGALVNMDHARKLSSMSSQRWLLTLSNGLEFIVSKRLAHNVRQFLNW